MKLRIVAASGDINAKQVAKAAFPDYTGRKIKTNLTGTVSFYNLNWDGGTKNEFALVRLEDLQVATGQDFAPWLNPIEGKSAKIPAGFAVVEHSFFMGKDAGITVYFSSDNLASKPTSELQGEIMRLRVKANLRTALIKGEEFYTWYVYNEHEPLKLVTKNQKRTFDLRYGSKFGIRPSHNGKEIRLVSEDHGMTIVFTITPEAKEKLISNSRQIQNLPVGVAKTRKVATDLKQAAEDSPGLMPRGPQRIKCNDLAALHSYIINCGKKLKKMKDPGFSNAPSLTKTYWVDGKTLVAEWDPIQRQGWFYGLTTRPHSAERKAAKWIYTIDLSRPWKVLDMLQEAESNIKTEFQNIADILDKVPDALRVPGRGFLNLHKDIEGLINNLRKLAESDASSDELLEEGDQILQELYDWADLVKVWIKTTS